MRPISNRPFLKRTRPTGRRPANRRVRAGACAVGKVSPHVSWTSRITEKLARRTPWLGINPEAMILACVARPWILLRQTVLRQIQAGTPTSPASPKEHKGPRSNESNHWLKAQSPLAILRHLAGEPIPSSTARLMLESARNCVPQPAIFSTRLRRNSAVEFAEKPAGLQRTRPLHGDAIPSRALLLSLANHPCATAASTARGSYGGSESERRVHSSDAKAPSSGGTSFHAGSRSHREARPGSGGREPRCDRKAATAPGGKAQTQFGT